MKVASDAGLKVVQGEKRTGNQLDTEALESILSLVLSWEVFM